MRGKENKIYTLKFKQIEGNTIFSLFFCGVCFYITLEPSLRFWWDSVHTSSTKAKYGDPDQLLLSTKKREVYCEKIAWECVSVELGGAQVNREK